MNIFALSGILISVSSSALAILMFIIGKQRLHYIWGFFCICAALWGFGVYKITTTQDIAQADFLWRIIHIGVIFIPILFTHFIYEFLQKKNRLFIILIYTIGLFFLTANFSGNLFIANMRWVFNQFYYDSPPGILYIPFTIFFFGLSGYSFFLLWKAYRISPNFKKIQISYFFLGTAIGFAGGGLSFLPVYKIDLYPFGNLTVFLYPIIITYAILKKNLFEIKVVLTQFLVGAITILLSFNIVYSKSSFEYVWKGAILFAFIIFGYLLIKSVINEIKRREEMEELTKKLERANKDLKKLDEAKSEFVSIASHQLRAPLTVIKGYISMILDKTYGEMPENIIKAITNMGLSNDRLIKLVNDLLSISRIEAGRMEIKMENFSIEEIISSVIEELKNIAKEKGLYLKFEKPKIALPQVLVDGDKIRQVILNLIDNAIKYTRDGGITVSLKIPALPAGRENLKLKIIISDTGEGMTREEISKVFESFTRGSAGKRLHTEGAGLGLYIAKKFAEMHNGKIWVESKGRGKGSTFYIELPIK